MPLAVSSSDHHAGPRRLLVLLAFIFCAENVLAAELKPETVKAWERYVELTEQRIAAELDAGDGFLVLDSLPESEAAVARQTILSGEIFVRKMTTENEEGKSIKIPKGIVHHWFGAIMIRNATLSDVLDYAQAYDDHYMYVDEVEESRLVSRSGDVYRIFMRLKRKKGITVYYKTEHTVEYQQSGPGQATSRSVATRIVQLEDAGKPQESEKPEGNDSGFMWRLNSYWRFKQEADAVIVECESMSLSRGIPLPLGFIVKPFVMSVPRESLESTLGSMRDGVMKRQASVWPRSFIANR
jgi:hypothetical protein